MKTKLKHKIALPSFTHREKWVLWITVVLEGRDYGSTKFAQFSVDTGEIAED